MKHAQKKHFNSKLSEVPKQEKMDPQCGRSQAFLARDLSNNELVVMKQVGWAKGGLKSPQDGFRKLVAGNLG